MTAKTINPVDIDFEALFADYFAERRALVIADLVLALITALLEFRLQDAVVAVFALVEVLLET